MDETAEDLSGQRIGNWRIDKPLSRGGLATVYLAHRDDGQYEQWVAFKVLRRGLDTGDVIARFRKERQILSSLEHPAIAQIIDGGTLKDGRPYLVLDYVDGVSITGYCRSRDVSIADRVRLIIEILQALQHAHKNLVVHRDIKPSNILVTADGRVTLLDFGIAKLLDPTGFPDAEAQTQAGASMLTPGYASPEQLAGKTVTTASDIYQVGVILCELLAGIRPGDLDATIQKAMHGDPSQRYASANEMIADLRRYLEGMPVMARTDTFTYRYSSLIRRRPLLLPSVALGFVIVAGYVVTLTNYSRQIRTEQQRASAAESFMVDVLGSADPYRPADPERGRNIRVVDALDIGVERLRSEIYGDDPALKASLLKSIADVYGNLAEHQKAIVVRSEALALERRLFGDTSREVVESLRDLAHQYRTIGKYDVAEPLYVEQLARAQELYPPDHPELGVAEAAFGLLQLRRGNTASSRAFMESAVQKLRRSPEKYAQDLIQAIVTLARVRHNQSGADTLALLVEARELADSVFGPDTPQAALARTQYATTLSVLGEFEEAEKYFTVAIQINESRLGREHGATLMALTSLGGLFMNMGRYEQAEETYREVLGHYLAQYGSAHRGVADNYQNLAAAIAAQGRHLEAVALHRQAYESSVAVLGETNVAAYEPLLSMAYAQLQTGEFAAAESTARVALEKLSEIDSAEAYRGRAACLAALAMEAQGQTAGARQMLEDSRESLRDAVLPAPYAELCLLTETTKMHGIDRNSRYNVASNRSMESPAF